MRYFFDILSERLETIDDEGCELGGEREMQREAARLLAEIAADEIRIGTVPALTARVRDPDGRPVYRAVLTIEGQRLQ